jgi:multiple sugar transport system substrate-binding protein
MERKRSVRTGLWLVSILLAASLMACSKTETADGNRDPGDSPAKANNVFDYGQTATVRMYNSIVSAEYYKDYIEPHIKKKFPNVTIEHIVPKDSSLDNLIAAQKIPDIYLTTSTGIVDLQNRGLTADLDPIAKTYGLDFSVFEESMLQSVRNMSGNGQLLGLPWTYGSTALFYNKDIFDRYGVPYPKDGMTWDSQELRDLVVKFNRPSDGVIGIMFNLGNMIGQNQLALPFVDPKTYKALVNNDGFKYIIDTFAELYRLGGSAAAEDFDTSGNKAFTQKRNVAMWAGNAVYPQLIDMQKAGTGFNWDIVSLPTFKQAPGAGTSYFGAAWAISALNGKQDLAAHIITLMTSKEVQIEGGSLIRYPTLKDPEVKNSLGKGEAFLEVKNMKALYINKIPEAQTPTKYDSMASGVVVRKAGEVLRGLKDSNTALREAAEEIEKQIAAQEGAK